MSTYEPRDGDKIALTLHGSVVDHCDLWVFRPTNGQEIWIDDFEEYEVEVHERGSALPTAPGSIISNNYKGSRWVLAPEGWRPLSAGAGVTGFMFGDAKNYTVVFDAGAS